LPQRQDWFLAEILVLHTIGETGDFVLHNNFVLIHAETPDAAVAAAESRGREYEDSFVNTDGEAVLVRFIGLRNLHQVYEDLGDGAEILYEDLPVSSKDEALALIRPKGELSVFCAGS
jgi:hypothetical protein